MKNFLFRLYLRLIKLGARLTRINEKKVVVLNGAGRSGSNGYLFAKYMRANHPDYDVCVVEPWPSSHLPLQAWLEIGRAKFVVTTHSPFKIHPQQVNIQFWHGIPLKRMGIMAGNTKQRDNHRNAKLWQRNADVVCSSSDLYETLMSACCAIAASKYQKVGFPRVDFLQKPAVTKKQLLQELFHQTDETAAIGIYMPTFRYEMEDEQVEAQLKSGNFLTLPDFDVAKLNDALKAQHQYLVVKLHPYEMRFLANYASSYSNLAFLNNDYFSQHDCDLYEVLGVTDFLVTDFSSVYFDYLNLKRPVIFITNYLKQYEKVRGLLIGPYQKVVPGPCVKTQAELLAALRRPDHYQQKRQYWLDLTNQLQGESACANVFDLIKQR